MCFFKNRGCATLAQPAAETSQLLKLDGLPYARLKPEFRAGVEAPCFFLLCLSPAGRVGLERCGELSCGVS